MSWERWLSESPMGSGMGIAVKWRIEGYALAWSRAGDELRCLVLVGLEEPYFYLSCDPADGWALEAGWARLEAAGAPARPEGWAD